jgi:Antibiotic biosynthesis monooxygenase
MRPRFTVKVTANRRRRSDQMSVLVTMKVRGDTDQFRRWLETDVDRLRELAKAAQGSGCLHHRFGVGAGYVVVMDEWETAEAFQTFISSDEIAAVMRDAGAQAEPEVDITEAVASADQF